jgi:peptide deformylase
MSTITDLTYLRTISSDVDSAKEARKILAVLETELSKHESGLGLSAIQIGIEKRVGLIIHKGKRYELINPTIVDEHDEFTHYREGCLSIPGKYINVKRFKQVTITNMVLDDTHSDGWFEQTHSHFIGDKMDDMTTLAIQHEIDHFNGVLIIDKEERLVPITAESKIGRNEPCPCGSGKKYKKCCSK